MAKDKTLSATQAREEFREVISRAEYLRESTTIEKFGKPVAKVVPVDHPSIALAEQTSKTDKK